MRSPSQIKAEIEDRLKKYLSKDKTGLRRAVLELFVRKSTLTVKDVFEKISEKFKTTYNSIASMVGTIASRLGILHTKKDVDNQLTVYELKERYRDLVLKILDYYPKPGGS